jgi:hypothetical protein
VHPVTREVLEQDEDVALQFGAEKPDYQRRGATSPTTTRITIAVMAAG